MIQKITYKILFFLLISFQVVSQTQNEYSIAKVSYSVIIHQDRNSEIYKVQQKYFPDLVVKAEAIAPELDFSLVFNDSTSIFYLEKKLYSDVRAVSFAISNINYHGRIQQQPNHFITEELEEDFGKFLVSRPYQEWELHDESKMIDDYLCFKATTFYTVTTPQGKVFKYNFTAWYTPQLPYQFGPAGYGNLPGLIIELQGARFTYGVKKIEFYENLATKANEMPKLKKLKCITEEEFEGLAAMDELRRRKKD